MKTDKQHATGTSHQSSFSECRRQPQGNKDTLVFLHDSSAIRKLWRGAQEGTVIRSINNNTLLRDEYAAEHGAPLTRGTTEEALINNSTTDPQ